MTFWTLSSWKQSNNESNLTDSDEVDLCHQLPDVTRSNSSETSTTIDSGIKHSESFVTVRMLKAPCTPEGLRPRPTVDDLRKELILEDSNLPKRDFLVEKKVDQSRMLPTAPSRSWSMPSQPVLSPRTTTQNVFFTHQVDFSASDSPRLHVGQAQTAVGSFVAMCQKEEPSQPWSPSGEGYDADADRSHGNNSFQFHHPPVVIEEEWDEKKEEYSDIGNDVYYPLDNDPIYMSRTPPRVLHKKNSPLSPFSTNVSLEASPSSLAKPYTQNKPAHLDTSFSSGAALLAHADRSKYDFGHFGGQETKEIHVKFTSDQTHVSGMTQSIALDNEGTERELPESDESEDVTSYGWGDESLRHQKIQNQRRLREELLLAIVERLQDDVQLIADVYKADPAALQTNWFVETPMNKEGLLTGFSPENRLALVRNLSLMLDEMNVAQPEDFFLSPSQVQLYVQPHDELQSAISFCRTLVQMAVPTQDLQYEGSDGRWSLLPGYRPAMGIIPPESPRECTRGGDTSVFTLPSASADTPMTSNVSFSTTIASSKQTSRKSPVQVDGLQVRQTIEMVSTLLQKLSTCCHALLEMKGLHAQKSVRITKDIKRYYQQLLAVDHNKLRSLVDAFEFEIAPPPLSQLVSNDDEDENEQTRRTRPNQVRALVVPPPRVIRNHIPKTSMRGNTTTPGSCSSSSHELFSPQTLDMMSNQAVPTTVPEEYDDLRRQVGSVDYDDEDEMREGPESCERE